MKTSKWKLCICLAAILTVAVAFVGRLCGQTLAPQSSAGSGVSERQSSIQVDRVEPGEIELAYSFQVAIYESLVQELTKTHRFKDVFREGDRKASDAPNLLVLKTTIVKYTAGSETRRAVTTVSGATKVCVRSQLVTRDGKIVLDRTVDGKVRFFGSNLRATQNLARNVVKVIEQSTWSESEQAGATTPRTQLTAESLQERH
jgi:hypothetical protein